MNEWSPMEMFTAGWEKLKADPGGIIIPVLVFIAAAAAPNLLFAAVGAGLQIADGGEGGILVLVAALVRLVGSFAQLLVTSYLLGGWYKFWLNVVRGQQYGIGDIFSGGAFFVPILIFQILAGIAGFIGLCLCVLPALFVAIVTQFGPLLIVDKGVGGIGALTGSWELVKPHLMPVAIWSVLAVCVYFVGFFACCVGVIPAAAVILIAQVSVYERISGHPQAQAAQPPATF